MQFKYPNRYDEMTICACGLAYNYSKRASSIYLQVLLPLEPLHLFPQQSELTTHESPTAPQPPTGAGIGVDGGGDGTGGMVGIAQSTEHVTSSSPFSQIEFPQQYGSVGTGTSVHWVGPPHLLSPHPIGFSPPKMSPQQ